MYEEDRYADASGAIGGALSMDPTHPVYITGADARYTGGYYQTLGDKPGNSPIADKTWAKVPNSHAPQNPVALLNQKHIGASSNDYSGNVEMDYKIHGFEDLHIHASLGAQHTESTQKDDIANESFSNNYFGWHGITKYRKYNIVGNAYLEYGHKFGAHDTIRCLTATCLRFHSVPMVLLVSARERNGATSQQLPWLGKSTMSHS